MMVEIFLLSLIQGITEFLPISSSSHLIIFSNYTNFENQSLSIDISLHIGSFLAVITFFYKDLINFFKNKKLFLKILIASAPVMFFGFLLVQTNFIDKLRNIEVIGWSTFIFGILLYLSDRYKLKKNISSDFNYKSAIFIGFFQILSLVPGVSRSGISITAARFLKFKRFDSAKISFLLSIPTLGAVSLFGLKNLLTNDDINISILNLVSIFLSYIFSLITINYFLKYIKNFSLSIFVIYRIILGLILLFFAYL
jgi:undecaprenyl-diphosphatase